MYKMDSLCCYALEKALDEGNNDIINMCFNQPINYKVTNKQLKKYVKLLLVEYNINVDSEYDTWSVIFISHTKQMYELNKQHDDVYDYYDKLTKIEVDEFLVKEDTTKIDIDIIFKLVLLLKDELSLKTLLYLQKITDVIDVVFVNNKYAFDCIPYLLEHMMFNNNVDAVYELMGKTHNARNMIKDIIIESVKKQDYTYLQFVIENKIYVDGLLNDLLSCALDVFDKNIILYCCKNMNEYKEIIIKYVYRLVKKCNYTQLLFLYDNGLFTWNEFITINRMETLHYYYETKRIEYLPINYLKFELVFNDIFIHNKLISNDYNYIILNVNYCGFFMIDKRNYNNLYVRYTEIHEKNKMYLVLFSYKIYMLIQHFNVFDVDINKVIRNIFKDLMYDLLYIP